MTQKTGNGHETFRLKRFIVRPAPVSLILLLSSIAILYCFSITYAEEGPLVNSIEIRGLKRVEEGALRKILSQKTGQPVSSSNISKDIEAIYRLGYFEDVKVETEFYEGGLKIIYLVKEKPAIISINFRGNEEFEDDKLREKINITPGAISDISLIHDNVAKLKEFYESEGYWLAGIVPIVKRVSDEEVELTFLIEEGDKVKIDEIVVEGNEAISDGKIKKAIKTRSWWLLSFLTSTGYYQKTVMRDDVERIRELYYNNGYLNVVVSEPELRLTPDRREMIITIRVSEGPQFTVSGIRFRGNSVAGEDELRGLMPLKEEEIFSRKRLQDGIQGITDFYSERGYAMASAEPNITTDEKARTVSVLMNIDEGDIYRVGRIEVLGNTRTIDKVIRREIRLDEGDIFNNKLLRRSYERINNLNFFETVDVVPKPRPEEKKIDLDVKVKEKATGMLSIGGGYSTVDKFVGMIDLTQANLFGTGKYLRLMAQIGGTSTLYELSYRDPWFLDRPVSMTLSLYRSERDYIAYDQRATGGSIGFGKRFSEYWSTTLTYRLEESTVYNVSDDASNIIKDQIGTTLTSSITSSLSRDTRDNFLDPSRGSRNSVYITYAGIGGDNYFIKGVIDSGWYLPIGRTTVGLRGRVGYATGLFDHEIPLYERFYIGGINTVRGLGFGEGGPRDENGEVIGGTSELIINAEYIFPIAAEVRLKGVVFFDAGRAYDDSESFGTDIRYTAGTGIRWISPFGPLRIEYGYNLDKRDGEDSSKIEFAFGTIF